MPTDIRDGDPLRLGCNNVTLIDATGAKPRVVSVIVEGDRITAITRGGRERIPTGATIGDGRGKYLIPGMWDMHVHVEAEAEMCRRMGPRIRLYGLRHLRSPSVADDLVQQVLLKTLEALRAARLREPDKLAQFVLGTCRMTLLDLRRSSYRQEELLAMFGGDLVPDQSPIPRLDDRHLARCVQALKERERSVVVMTFYDEQTGAETARILRTSEANVRVIRHRAIQQLRVCTWPAPTHLLLGLTRPSATSCGNRP